AGDPFHMDRPGPRHEAYPIGTAILQVPFFLVAHGVVLAANVFGAGIPSHGYTLLDQRLTLFGPLLAGFATVAFPYPIPPRPRSPPPPPPRPRPPRPAPARPPPPPPPPAPGPRLPRPRGPAPHRPRGPPARPPCPPPLVPPRRPRRGRRAHAPPGGRFRHPPR